MDHTRKIIPIILISSSLLCGCSSEEKNIHFTFEPSGVAEISTSIKYDRNIERYAILESKAPVSYTYASFKSITEKINNRDTGTYAFVSSALEKELDSIISKMLDADFEYENINGKWVIFHREDKYKVYIFRTEDNECFFDMGYVNFP